MRITFLGTGTSHGVPRIACDCEVCTSPDLKNKRLRCSILVTDGDINLLVDTTPDLRTQALTYRIKSLDAVLYTHTHADHLNGLDDLRCYCYHRDALPCYGSPESVEHIATRFDYAVREDLNLTGMPRINLVPVTETFQLGSLSITPVPIQHGKIRIAGYRFDQPGCGSFLYASDCSGIPEDSLPHFRNLDLLILDALRHRPHPTHFNVEQSVTTAQRFQPRRTLLIHIDHDLDHAATNAQLPENVRLAYDGLEVEV